MRRIAVGIEYDGSRYSGWQVQQGAASLQAALEDALGRVADAPLALICAGRTDAGVHARAQVGHFDTAAVRTPRAWLLGANTGLPGDISLSWVRGVPGHFHARYSALARTYRYLILNRQSRSALSQGRALLVHQGLDAAAMAQGAQWLIGEHDFSAFRAAECQARSPVRNLRALTVQRAGDWIAIDVTANAFLHHMVRNIVGLLIVIGQGRAPPERAQTRLASRSRTPGELTAAAHGLYLWRVHYPAAFGLPADSAMIGTPAFEEPLGIAP
jgi:tRNA pseudouridine38-40 synthase